MRTISPWSKPSQFIASPLRVEVFTVPVRTFLTVLGNSSASCLCVSGKHLLHIHDMWFDSGVGKVEGIGFPDTWAQSWSTVTFHAQDEWVAPPGQARANLQLEKTGD